jgi:hypothetical protein
LLLLLVVVLLSMQLLSSRDVCSRPFPAACLRRIATCCAMLLHTRWCGLLAGCGCCCCGFNCMGTLQCFEEQGHVGMATAL